MEIRRIKMGKETDFSIYFIGDFHIGNKSCSFPELEESFQYLKKNDGYIVGMGDYLEGIIAGDKRFSLDQLDEDFRTTEEQAKKTIQLFKEIDSDRILGLLAGNHELKLKRNTDTDMASLISDMLDTDYLKYSAFMRFTSSGLDGEEFRCIVHHGFGGGRTTGSKVNKINRFAKQFPSTDLVVMGHHHLLGETGTPSTLELDKDELKSNYIRTAYSGGFLKNYQEDTINYGEKKGYNPLPIGFLEVKIEDLKVNEIVSHILG